jgi:phosphoribosylanthranilate isomerase
MTKIKLCGLRRECDIEAANLLQPEYIGFVFAPKSRRYVAPERAAALRKRLSNGIVPVGVFVNERPEAVAGLLERNIIAVAQLHGEEDEVYIQTLRNLTGAPIIKAFSVSSESDVPSASESTADFILLDSGSGGTGTAFDRTFLRGIKRPYFLAGGLSPENIREAVEAYHPYAVDVSSGIETDGQKDKIKMTAFVNRARGAQRQEENQ